jgi:catechol 2,3-dioxygenase-like lactoylglutathione lyase family enzyme
VIFGAHVIIFSNDASSDRAFFRDVLGFPSVDAGHDWLIRSDETGTTPRQRWSEPPATQAYLDGEGQRRPDPPPTQP